MALTVETYGTAAEAGRALSSAADARYLGGGTIVMRAVNDGDQGFSRILRSTDRALSEIRAEGGRLTIGAGVTMAELIEHRETEALAPVARAVGGPAVRTMATIGGNIFAAHPYGDLAAALLALDGIARLAEGREMPLADLFTQRGRGTAPLVTAVSIARPEPGSFRFRKVSRVKPKGVSVLSISAWLPVSGGQVRGARVAYGAMAATPVRMPGVERALEGQRLDENGVRGALVAAVEGLDPPDCSIATGWYRREVAPVHLRRLLLGEG